MVFLSAEITVRERPIRIHGRRSQTGYDDSIGHSRCPDSGGQRETRAVSDSVAANPRRYGLYCAFEEFSFGSIRFALTASITSTML